MELRSVHGSITCMERDEEGVGVRLVNHGFLYYLNGDSLRASALPPFQKLKLDGIVGPYNKLFFPYPCSYSNRHNCIDEKLASFNASNARKLMHELMGALRESNPAVSLSSTLIISTHHIALLNSRGLAAEQELGSLDAYAKVFSTKRQKVASSQTKFGSARFNKHELMADILSAGKRAARLTTTRRLRKPAHGKIILGPRATSSLLRAALGAAICVDNIFDSFLRNRMNKTIGPRQLNLSDDGELEGGRFSSKFDAEGVRRQRTQLIERGVLTNCISDVVSGHLAKVASTGNASRGKDWDHRVVTSTSPTNLVMGPGRKELEDLVAESEKAVVLTDMNCNADSSSRQVNCIIEAGYLVKSRDVKSDFTNAIVILDLPGLFRNIREVGADTICSYDVTCPSIELAETTVYPFH